MCLIHQYKLLHSHTDWKNNCRYLCKVSSEDNDWDKSDEKNNFAFKQLIFMWRIKGKIKLNLVSLIKSMTVEKKIIFVKLLKG